VRFDDEVLVSIGTVFRIGGEKEEVVFGIDYCAGVFLSIFSLEWCS
jgi:hypothetical protein